MKNTFIYIMLVSIFMTSCYKDEGNYNYKKVGEVAISFPAADEDKIIEAISFKEFTVEPTIDTKLDDNNFTYEWLIESDVVSNERILHFENLPLDPRVAVYYAKLTIKDKSTGFAYSNYFKILVNNIVGSGWFILSDYNGTTHLAHKASSDNTFTQDIFELINGKKLGSNGVNISLGGQYNDYMHVMTKDGNSKGSVFSRSTFKEYYPMTKSFAGAAPTGSPMGMTLAWGQPNLMLWDGIIYSAGGAQPFSLFVNTPLSASTNHFNNLYSTGDSNTYMYDTNTGSWTNFKWGRLTVGVPDYGAQAFPVANSGYEEIAIGIYPKDYFDSYILSIMKDPADGKIYELLMSTGWGAVLTETKVEMPGSDLLESDSKFIVKDATYYYFTSGSKLYRRAYKSNDAPTLIHTFDSKVVYFQPMPNANDYSFVVATYDDSNALTGDIYFCTDNLTSFDITESYLDVAGKIADMKLKN